YLACPSYTHSPWRLARAGIRRSFQVPRTLPALTLIENLMLSGDWKELRRLFIERENYRRRAYGLAFLESWMPDLNGSRRAGELSFGQQKFLEILRIFFDVGHLYLLDEPLSGLGPTFRSRIARLVQVAIRNGASVVYVDHSAEEFLPLTTRVL